MWLWSTVFISILCYVPLFLWSRGNLTVSQRRWWKVRMHWKAVDPSAEDVESRARPSAPLLALLAYPFAYSIVVLPVSVVRWIEFGQTAHNGVSTVPSAAAFATAFLHNSFGAVNVALLLTTRPNLLLFQRPERDGEAPLVERKGRTTAAQGHAPSMSPSPVRSSRDMSLTRGRV